MGGHIGAYPLHLAAVRNDVSALRRNIQLFGWESVETLSAEGKTTLQVAVALGRKESVSFLVSRANLNVNNSNGTPLIIASRKGDIEILKILLSAGAKPNHFDARRNTALFYAAKGCFSKCVSELIKYGAEAGWRNLDGKTALDLSSEKHHDTTNILRRYEV